MHISGIKIEIEVKSGVSCSYFKIQFLWKLEKLQKYPCFSVVSLKRMKTNELFIKMEKKTKFCPRNEILWQINFLTWYMNWNIFLDTENCSTQIFQKFYLNLFLKICPVYFFVFYYVTCKVAVYLFLFNFNLKSNVMCLHNIYISIFYLNFFNVSKTY